MNTNIDLLWSKVRSNDALMDEMRSRVAALETVVPNRLDMLQASLAGVHRYTTSLAARDNQAGTSATELSVGITTIEPAGMLAFWAVRVPQAWSMASSPFGLRARLELTANAGGSANSSWYTIGSSASPPTVVTIFCEGPLAVFGGSALGRVEDKASLAVRIQTTHAGAPYLSDMTDGIMEITAVVLPVTPKLIPPLVQTLTGLTEPAPDTGP